MKSGKVSGGKKSKAVDASNVVLWLTPAGGSAPSSPAHRDSPRLRLVQKNKSFEPHVMAVTVGSVVQFPNRDPFFHNVFSLFEGKRFDLGLYEAGSTRDLLFDKPGISYIFCNIHAEMSAVVVAVETPYYGISDRRGQVEIPNVPAGRYTLRLWYEASTPELLKSMTREVTVSAAAPTLGLLRLPAAAEPQAHKNMYGHDYPPPTPDSSTYERP
jgi:plastocyanin